MVLSVLLIVHHEIRVKARLVLVENDAQRKESDSCENEEETQHHEVRHAHTPSKLLLFNLINFLPTAALGFEMLGHLLKLINNCIHCNESKSVRVLIIVALLFSRWVDIYSHSFWVLFHIWQAFGMETVVMQAQSSHHLHLSFLLACAFWNFKVKGLRYLHLFNVIIFPSIEALYASAVLDWPTQMHQASKPEKWKNQRKNNRRCDENSEFIEYLELRAKENCSHHECSNSSTYYTYSHLAVSLLHSGMAVHWVRLTVVISKMDNVVNWKANEDDHCNWLTHSELPVQKYHHCHHAYNHTGYSQNSIDGYHNIAGWE